MDNAISKELETRNNAGRKKGTPKTGGRKKGTPNKNSLTFVDELNQRNFKPLAELIDMYQRTEKEEIQVDILKTMLKYIYPQRKAIELQNSDSDYEIIINRKAVDVERKV